MPPPKDTVWKLEPHTLGKHLILRAYLNAWFPILSKWNQRILFIDAFAGPGEYEEGEDGSPVIALKALIEHQSRKKISAEVAFIFIEERKDRCDHLRELVRKYKPQLPVKSIIEVENSTFDEKMTEVLNQIEEQNKRLAPCFVMIDPFGISGTPMSVIQRILRNPKSEVYISIMYNHINRFLDTSEFEQHLEELYGCTEWKRATQIIDTEERELFLFELYKDQLRKAGAKYVLKFDIYEGNKHIYSIIFGTKNPLGCDRMKAAIWKIAPSGNFRYVGTKSKQMTFNLKTTNFEPLKRELQDEFIGKGWVSIEEVVNYVSSDKTDYHSGQVKKVLRQMEEDKEIEADPHSRKKKRTHPDGTKLSFLKKK